MNNLEGICFVCKEEYELELVYDEIMGKEKYEKDYYHSNNGYTLSSGLGVDINNKYYCYKCLIEMGIKYRKQRDKINSKKSKLEKKN